MQGRTSLRIMYRSGRENRSSSQLEPSPISIIAKWEILVEANVDGERKVFRVRDGSRPFRTTAYADSYGTAYKFDFMKNRFVKLPPGSTPFG